MTAMEKEWATANVLASIFVERHLHCESLSELTREVISNYLAARQAMDEQMDRKMREYADGLSVPHYWDDPNMESHHVE